MVFKRLTDVKDWFGQLDVPEMTGAFGHIAGAGLTATGAIHGALARIHQPIELGSTALHRFRVLNAAWGKSKR